MKVRARIKVRVKARFKVRVKVRARVGGRGGVLQQGPPKGAVPGLPPPLAAEEAVDV